MANETAGLLQELVSFALLLSVQVVLVLLLRKPVRALLGSIACYRLWLVTLLWLPAYLLGGPLLDWWDARALPTTTLQTGSERLQLLLNDWLFLPLENLEGAAGQASSTLFDLSDTVVLSWLAGVCLVLAWQGHKYWRFTRLVQQQGRPLSLEAATTAEVKSIFGNTLPILVLPGIGSAALFGIGQPVLLLPEFFEKHYDADQQHIILAHEAVHLRRHDNAWNLAAGLLLVLCWPNPLCWLAWRCFRFDQELSCDAHALTSCTLDQQKRYARTLLDAASLTVGFGPQPALSAWDNLDDLKERTLMIAQHLKNKVSPLVIQGSLSVIAVCGAAGMALLSGTFSPPTVAAESVYVADEAVARVLQESLELIKSEKFDEARTKLSVLNPPSLTPYERSRVEQMLFSLDIRDENPAAARNHMELALASGGMTEEEISTGRYQLAQSLLQEEKWLQGAAVLEEWLSTNSAPNGGPYYLLAAAYYNLKAYETALPHAERAVALGGDKPQEAWLQMLAALYLQTGQYQKALPVVRQQVSRFPDKEVYQQQLRSLEEQLRTI